MRWRKITLVALVVVAVGSGGYVWLSRIALEGAAEIFRDPHDTPENRERADLVRAVVEGGSVKVGSTNADLIRALGQPDGTRTPGPYEPVQPGDPVLWLLYVTHRSGIGIDHHGYWIGVDAADVVLSIHGGDISKSDVDQ